MKNEKGNVGIFLEHYHAVHAHSQTQAHKHAYTHVHMRVRKHTLAHAQTRGQRAFPSLNFKGRSFRGQKLVDTLTDVKNTH